MTRSPFAAGVAAFKATSYETAVELFTEAISENDSQARYFDARANAYEKLSKYKDALLDARQVIKLAPTSHKGYLRAGRLFRLSGKYSHAEKILVQGVENLSAGDAKGLSDIARELALVRELRSQIEYSPLSQLPAEMFIYIVELTAWRPLDYSATSKPRTKPPRSNPLFALMAVSRKWYQMITSTPRLWNTLHLAGDINRKNVAAKARTWAARARGIPVTLLDSAPSIPNTNLGIETLVISAAQEFASSTLIDTLEALGKQSDLHRLRRFVLSFVDGATSIEHSDKASRLITAMMHTLHDYCLESLCDLTLCLTSRFFLDFDFTAIFRAFPNLHALDIVGSERSGPVFRIRPDVFPAEDSPTEAVIPTRVRRLRIGGAAFAASSPLTTTMFPHLEDLDFDVADATIVWPLLSARNLRRYQVTIVGEQEVMSRPMPDIVTAWAVLESLRLGGARRFAPRMLDAAIDLQMNFARLTSLDLSYTSLSTRHLALFASENSPNLINLNLSATACAAMGVTLDLPRMTTLESLDVSHTSWVEDDTIRALVRLTPSLKRLFAIGLPGLTGRPLMELVRHRMPSQNEVNDAEKLSTQQPLARIHSHLVELRVENCLRLETAAVEWLRKAIVPGGFSFTYMEPIEKSRKRGR